MSMSLSQSDFISIQPRENNNISLLRVSFPIEKLHQKTNHTDWTRLSPRLSCFHLLTRTGLDSTLLLGDLFYSQSLTQFMIASRFFFFLTQKIIMATTTTATTTTATTTSLTYILPPSHTTYVRPKQQLVSCYETKTNPFYSDTKE